LIENIPIFTNVVAFVIKVAPINPRLSVEISIINMGTMISGTPTSQKYAMTEKVATPWRI